MTSADDVAQLRDADLAMLSHTPWPMNLAVSTGAFLARTCEEEKRTRTNLCSVLFHQCHSGSQPFSQAVPIMHLRISMTSTPMVLNNVYNVISHFRL